jgi:manganese/zinc/iron transport system permease protein
MEAYQLNAILTGVLAAVACALPGVFLVLRRLALVSDAIGHVVLLGIVLGFLLVGELGSPVLLVGAAATGLVLVAAVEALQRTRLVREDAAIGLVFPALFSLGVILVSRYARNVHLDVDAVLLRRSGLRCRELPHGDLGGATAQRRLLVAVLQGTETRHLRPPVGLAAGLCSGLSPLCLDGDGLADGGGRV